MENKVKQLNEITRKTFTTENVVFATNFNDVVGQVATAMDSIQVDATNFSDVAEAINILRDLEKKVMDPLTIRKKELYAPYKEIQKLEKERLTTFETLRNTLTAKANEYIATTKNTLEVVEIENEQGVIEQKTLTPEVIATTGLKNYKKYEVELLDISQVAPEFLMLNEKAIIDQAKKGTLMQPTQGFVVKEIDDYK